MSSELLFEFVYFIPEIVLAFWGLLVILLDVALLR